ncbi:MAG: aminotransferase class V-fold PLP-dependent enzyme [Pseudomonadales bacterium]|jgi:aspartate aminotransferase-like enzyme|nr:aminotransferase class V-fold PLP-dependent enzyme [Pseudomonadales bacterium]
MTALRNDIDPDGLLEYSVVFTDRSLNHMSRRFQAIMRDISATLREVYQASAVAVVPGGGTYGMEAVARQFAQDKRVLVIRNGFFSYRWSQIFAAARIPAHETVMKAAPMESGPNPAYAPAPIEQVVATIAKEKPALVFAPHVETAAGVILPDDYLKEVALATHAVGGIFVLDCIASGTVWVDMQALGVDVLISAPQKGWSASPCAALVMLSPRAEALLAETQSSSFAMDLKKWRQIMQAYENGGHAYHATLPTDALRQFHTAMQEAQAIGFDKLKNAQLELGRRARAMIASKGYKSLAALGFTAPGVVVSYTTDPDIHNSSKFARYGFQTAAGVPLMCDEAADFRTFRVGLFGLDKLENIERTVTYLGEALDKVAEPG